MGPRASQGGTGDKPHVPVVHILDFGCVGLRQGHNLTSIPVAIVVERGNAWLRGRGGREGGRHGVYTHTHTHTHLSDTRVGHPVGGTVIELSQEGGMEGSTWSIHTHTHTHTHLSDTRVGHPVVQS